MSDAPEFMSWRLECPVCRETYFASLYASWSCPVSNRERREDPELAPHQPIRVTPLEQAVERRPEQGLLSTIQPRGKPWAFPNPRPRP